MRYEVYEVGAFVLIAIDAPSRIDHVERVRAERRLIAEDDPEGALRVARAQLKQIALRRLHGQQVLHFERFESPRLALKVGNAVATTC